MTWYYASVTEVVATDGDKATLRVLYDDYAPDDPAGQDLINVPDDDTVTCDPAQPRVKASADDRLRIGKTFVWSRNSPREKREPGRWRITDIFDSLEEGADGVVLVFDVTRPDSLHACEAWYNRLREALQPRIAEIATWLATAEAAHAAGAPRDRARERSAVASRAHTSHLRSDGRRR